MHRLIFFSLVIIAFISCNPKLSNGLRVNDLNKDVEMITDKGTMIIRLSDSTPLHRDNFLRLVKQKYFDSVLFHRVIKNFMIQGGDPNSRHAKKDSVLGDGGPDYTIPAEFRTSLFHRKGVIAAAREGEETNPTKASSGSQFYIVQGRVFTDGALDAVEKYRLNGRKLDPAIRTVYKTIGGTPQLDQNYTVFGQTIKGMEVIDKVATTPTSTGPDRDRPLKDMRIIKARLIKRHHRLH